MLSMTEFALVALGGGIGGVARYWISGAVSRALGQRFPWGTLVVNASGALVLGVLAGVLGPRAGETGSLPWLFLAVGILGSYTTVSSFSLQSFALARDGEAGRAALNVAASLVFCLIGAGLGLAVGGALPVPTFAGS
jgi:fluoride exporter